jgi:hypothetical protein
MSQVSGELLSEKTTTFRLSGGGRDWIFRMVRVENEDGRAPIHFAVRMISETKYVYIGVYQPENGWVTMTRASQYSEDSEIVRAVRWVSSLVWSGNMNEMEDKGFKFQIIGG